MGFGRNNFCDAPDMFSLFMKKTYLKAYKPVKSDKLKLKINTQ